MIDIVDKTTRSRMMSNIRSSNTKPEVLARKALHKLGYRFRLDSKVGKIKPDIVLRKYKVVIFVHGCYWHQHQGCKLAYSDRNYSDKWLKKFSDNKIRDQRVSKQLIEQGWRVGVIWECATRDSVILEQMITKIHHWINESNNVYFETDYQKT
ncbi:MAG: DNA mismatch endonuclease Vsr [Pseudomonadota bacterium]